MDTNRWNVMTEAGSSFPEAVARNPQKTLLIFDFDGTLAHMDPDPEAVEMVEASAEAMERLTNLGVGIAIISGRPVDSLLRLGQLEGRAAFSRAVLLGQYGVERLDMETGERRDPPTPASIGRARVDLEALVAQHPGAHLEDKGRALAVHTRRMPDPEGAFEALADPVMKIAEEHTLTVEPGRFVWELRTVSTDKGDALRELLDTYSPEAALMAGDDLGDIAAFDALKEFAADVATCVLVSGSAEQPAMARRADVLAQGPDGVAEWLAYLATTVEGNNGLRN